MSDEIVASDVVVVDLLRKRPSMTVSDFVAELQVTATAVRQRLTRLMAQGYVERHSTKGGRGRPSHYYSLTGKGRRKAGSNFSDLAVALWKELVSIPDSAVRRALIARVSERLAQTYAERLPGLTVEQRMEQLATIFRERRVPFSVENGGGQLVLKATSCPYPDLADRERHICAMERQLLTRLLGTGVKQRQCRLDGDDCCAFEPDLPAVAESTSGVAAGG
ncbi:MAG: MarR family transcriptional regulator [Pirellulaceae bacterium]|jgi:predicted ArsR family transcriptional regulator|nr:MarR family transcriptional regulator [Pirellulaceae bacterium]